MSSTKKGEILPPAGKKTEPKTFYVQKTIGQDTWLVMAQSQIELEDEWASLYYTAQNQSNIFLMPPFEPEVLLNLVITNNVLSQCIEAMEVNVDGTGHTFVPFDEDAEIDPEEEQRAKSLFEQPYPGLSMVAIRRVLRKELESVGYAYLEVLRNLNGEIVGWRNIKTHNVRMVKLDEPVMVTKTVTRDGEDVELNMWVRERRFAQRVALKTLVYYREFGATRNVDRNNGKWETTSQPIELQNRGTELLLFGVHPDIRTGYFLPRWINEMPSVVGNRKAEEQNLQFLDSGGMPPAIIFVQGGTLAKDTSDQLKAYLSGQNKNKYRAVVVEAQSSSGSLEAAGNVKVTVERFGAERAQDAMYMKYDANTEEHVRVGFRLPPLFLGKPNDYNFATAQTAYLVAEEQVFNPERAAFDAVINATIMKDLGFKTIKYQSKPTTLKDVATTLKALGMAKDLATRESMLEVINKLTGLNLELATEPQPDTVTGAYQAVDANGNPVPSTNGGRPLPPGATPPPQQTPQPGPQRGAVQKPAFQQAPPKAALPKNPAIKPGSAPKPALAAPAKKSAIEMIDLAQDYVRVKGLVQKAESDPVRAAELKEEIAALGEHDRQALNSLVAMYTYGSNSPDLSMLAGRL